MAQVHTLFAAVSPDHAQHDAIFGEGAGVERPHRFWAHYNQLLVRHGITHEMIQAAVDDEGRRCDGRLLRPGVGDLLAMCDAAGVLVIILSAGIEQVCAGLRRAGLRLCSPLPTLSCALRRAPHFHLCSSASHLISSPLGSARSSARRSPTTMCPCRRPAECCQTGWSSTTLGAAISPRTRVAMARA